MRIHQTAVVGLLLLLALIASSCKSDAGNSQRFNCTYVPRETLENPTPELDTFENCAIPEGTGFRIRPEHFEALSFDHDRLATILVGEWHYVRQDGAKVAVVTYDNGPDRFSEGLARTVIDGKIAYIDRMFQIVVTAHYDWGWPFEDGLALVCNGCRSEKLSGEEHTARVGGDWGFIEKVGNEVVPVRYSRDEAYDALDQAEPSPPQLGQTCCNCGCRPTWSG